MTLTLRNDAPVWAFVALLVLVLVAVVASGGGPSGVLIPALLPLGIAALVVAVLTRLTVTVDGGVLSVSLGLGAFRRRYALAELVDVRSGVLPPSPFAVGVRWLPDGWLYAIGGGDFTELRFADGSRLVLGVVNEDLNAALRTHARR